MNERARLRWWAWFAMCLPIALGALLCYVRPESAWLWAVAMVFLPAVWSSINEKAKLFGKVQVGILPLHALTPSDVQRTLSLAMIFASLTIAVPMAARLADAFELMSSTLSDAIATRGANVLVGVYFVLRGNRLPKILIPLSDARYDAVAMQNLQRRTGRTFVLAGFTYASLWLVMTLSLAMPAGAVVIVVGVLVPAVALRAYGRHRRLPWRKVE